MRVNTICRLCTNKDVLKINIFVSQSYKSAISRLISYFGA